MLSLLLVLCVRWIYLDKPKLQMKTNKPTNNTHTTTRHTETSKETNKQKTNQIALVRIAHFQRCKRFFPRQLWHLKIKNWPLIHRTPPSSRHQTSSSFTMKFDRCEALAKAISYLFHLFSNNNFTGFPFEFNESSKNNASTDIIILFCSFF